MVWWVRVLSVLDASELGALLIVNMLMATCISITHSIHLLLKHTPHSLSSPKQYPKSCRCPLRFSSSSVCLQHPPQVHPYYSFTLSLFLFLSAPSMAATTAMYEPIKANPLLQEFDFPSLDVVEAKHRIHALLKNLEYFVLLFLGSFKVFWVIAF